MPGALVGGRLVHALSFADVYATEPAALLDLSRGALSLAGAVMGGTLSGAYVCRLLGKRVGRWADAAAWPLLLAIGLGKLALLLGGSGQGLPFDGPWAIAFDGPGPWVSADAATPAHPAQLYEGLWTLAGIPVVAWLARDRVPIGGGRWVGWGGLYLLAVGWWLAGRSVAGFAWRDEPRIGPLGVEQALAVAGLIAVAALLARTRGHERSPSGEGVS